MHIDKIKKEIEYQLKVKLLGKLKEQLVKWLENKETVSFSYSVSEDDGSQGVDT